MDKKFKIIFVHGYTATPDDDWYPPISKFLENSGMDFAVPHLPGEEHPHASEWLEKINSAVKSSDKPVVLVGHSLGTRAVLLYLEKYNFHAKAVFLIATFSNKLENATKYNSPDAYPDFFTHIIDTKKVKTLADKFVIVHSKDDGLEYSGAVEIAGELQAKLITYENRGHFSESNNAEVIFNVLKSELNF